MKGLSKKEVEIISYLEFYNKYFFESFDIDKFVKNKTQRYNVIKNLLGKKRIIKLNRTKYYLIPIKAKNGSWGEHSFVIIDEMCNSRDYFIGSWGAANYWKLTEQIPMKLDVYTTRRQGKIKILNIIIIFHRTTKKNIKEFSVIKEIQGHKFKIMSKEKSKEWIKSRG